MFIENKFYFFKRKIPSKGFQLQYYIKQRKKRLFIHNSKSFYFFKVGDIIEIIFYYKCIPLVFRGICLAVKRKYFILPDVILVLRNIIVKVGLELTVSYYYNRLYNLQFLDYKRKFYTFNKNKLYFIRQRVNRQSQVD